MPMRRGVRTAAVAVGIALLAGACSSGGGKKPSTASGEVAPTLPAAAPDSSTSSTALRVDALVLAGDGLGAVPFGMQAARAMNLLTQALGQAEEWKHVSDPAGCGATRMFRWKNLDVFVNEASARSGGRPGLVGWAMRAPATLGVKTDQGVAAGATVAALKAAYGDGVRIAGPTFEITTPNGLITGDLSGPADRDTVQVLRAGISCPI